MRWERRYVLLAVLVVAGVTVLTAVRMHGRAAALEQKVLQLRSELEQVGVEKRADEPEAVQVSEDPAAAVAVDPEEETLPVPMESLQRPPQPPPDAEVREIDPRHLPPTDAEERARLSRRIRSDAALDREWLRLESRMNQITDEIEREYVQQVMDSLVHVSELIDLLEEAETAAERQQAQRDMARAISLLIHHGRTDRNHRLAEYARSIGIDDVDEITDLIVQMERIFRETDTDWSRLFPQGRTAP